MSKKALGVVLPAALALSGILTGCGSVAGGGKGTLTVGVRNDIMNFGYQNADTGRYYGLEIDIAEEMANRMGYGEVEFVTVNPDNRKEMLLNGEIDCLVACYTISESREENFDFSPGYYTDTVRIMVEKSTLIEKVEDMKDMTIGIMSGASAGPQLANKLYEMGMITDQVLSNTDEGTEYEGMSVLKYPSYQALSNALEEGIVDGACMDGSIASTYMNDERCLLDVAVADQEYGVATQKDSELSGPVSETIQAMLDDGTIAAMKDKWN